MSKYSYFVDEFYRNALSTSNNKTAGDEYEEYFPVVYGSKAAGHTQLIAFFADEDTATEFVDWKNNLEGLDKEPVIIDDEDEVFLEDVEESLDEGWLYDDKDDTEEN